MQSSANVPGFALVVPPVREGKELARLERIPAHLGMKLVPQATVDQVIKNQPLPRIPRDNDIPDDEKTQKDLVEWLLMMLFPHLAAFKADFDPLSASNVELDKILAQTIESYKLLGMEQEIKVLQDEVTRFKQTRAALGLVHREGLVRRDTILPIQYLPDLFMAVPVWYHVVPASEVSLVRQPWTSQIDTWSISFMNFITSLFPKTADWSTLYQLFNRRVRPMQQYSGEVIPPQLARRMVEAAKVFDYVVVATPYHDRALAEWEQIPWPRPLDPYILGFKKGLPTFFVLGRFSNAGTFPLHSELVADTIEFLRANIGKLQHFDRLDRDGAWWSQAGTGKQRGDIGALVKRGANGVLKSFEEGVLFDWLRGEPPAPEPPRNWPPKRQS